MPVSSRWPLLLALSTSVLLACTETTSVEPQPLPDPGTRRIVLDLGLDPLPDGGELDLDLPDRSPPDGDPADAADPGDGEPADLALIDAEPADGQNGDE
ncbi:MAG: hypothetical protein R3F65_13595 [bacterium]|nr:hypothetical protein [Myxococcales bacterium]MCB9542677.1 hypothetical protein [Myxococcales bacterium]